MSLWLLTNVAAGAPAADRSRLVAAADRSLLFASISRPPSLPPSLPPVTEDPCLDLEDPCLAEENPVRASWTCVANPSPLAPYCRTCTNPDIPTDNYILGCKMGHTLTADEPECCFIGGPFMNPVAQQAIADTFLGRPLGPDVNGYAYGVKVVGRNDEIWCTVHRAALQHPVRCCKSAPSSPGASHPSLAPHVDRPCTLGRRHCYR